MKKSKIAKNNHKRTAIISHQKIESIDPGYYRIAISLRNNYRKMSSMRCDCHPWYDVI